MNRDYTGLDWFLHLLKTAESCPIVNIMVGLVIIIIVSVTIVTDQPIVSVVITLWLTDQTIVSVVSYIMVNRSTYCVCCKLTPVFHACLPAWLLDYSNFVFSQLYVTLGLMLTIPNCIFIFVTLIYHICVIQIQIPKLSRAIYLLLTIPSCL